MRWLQFILSHSIFISVCAGALCFQTYTLLQIPLDGFVFAFIFFSTLSSYNFYWLLSKYRFNKPATIPSFLNRNISYLLLFSVAAIGMVVCLYFLPHLFIHVAIAIFLTLLYSLPLWPFRFSIDIKNAGILKTVLLAFTWTYVTVVIPAANFENVSAVLTLMAARFFFIFMLCTIFDRRDVKTDKLHGLQSLATNVSGTTVHYIMMISFVLFIAAGIWIRYQFSETNQLVAFIITGLTVWWVYRLSLKKQGYIFYYFVVDGLMLFSAAISFLAELF